MMKFTVAFGMPSNMSLADFRTHYEVRHAALADSVGAFKRYICQYIQNYVIDVDADLNIRTPRLRGCSEVWFESLAQFDAAYAEPDYHLLREDEQRFADFQNMLVACANDVAIFGGEDRPRIKLLRFIERRAGVERGDFEQFWHVEYAQAVANSAAFRTLVPTYIQSRSLIGDENPLPASKVVDGIDEYWLRTLDDLASLITLERKISEQLGVGRIINLDERWDLVTEVRVVPGYDNSVALLALT